MKKGKRIIAAILMMTILIEIVPIPINQISVHAAVNSTGPNGTRTDNNENLTIDLDGGISTNITGYNTQTIYGGTYNTDSWLGDIATGYTMVRNTPGEIGTFNITKGKYNYKLISGNGGNVKPGYYYIIINGKRYPVIIYEELKGGLGSTYEEAIDANNSTTITYTVGKNGENAEANMTAQFDNLQDYQVKEHFLAAYNNADGYRYFGTFGYAGDSSKVTYDNTTVVAGSGGGSGWSIGGGQAQSGANTIASFEVLDPNGKEYKNVTGAQNGQPRYGLWHESYLSGPWNFKRLKIGEDIVYSPNVYNAQDDYEDEDSDGDTIWECTLIYRYTQDNQKNGLNADSITNPIWNISYHGNMMINFNTLVNSIENVTPSTYSPTGSHSLLWHYFSYYTVIGFNKDKCTNTCHPGWGEYSGGIQWNNNENANKNTENLVGEGVLDYLPNSHLKNVVGSGIKVMSIGYPGISGKVVNGVASQIVNGISTNSENSMPEVDITCKSKEFTIGTPIAPAGSGWIFAGWESDNTNVITNPINNNDGTWTFTKYCGAATLKAVWQKKAQLTINPNGGTWSDYSGYISDLYTYALDRDGEITGLRDWSNLLVSGIMSPGEVAEGFFNSPEYINKNKSTVNFVSDLYHVFLRRDADTIGLNSWVNYIDSGTYTRLDTIRFFASTDEFINIYNSYTSSSIVSRLLAAGVNYAITDPKKTGYKFTGWTKTQNDSTLNNQIFVMGTSGTILTANWTPITYKVVYNSNKPSNATNNVTGTTATSNHTYDEAKTLTINGYTLEGWKFTGWNSKSDGSGTKYDDKQSVLNLTTKDNDIVTLYAQWEPYSYNIIFNGNGNTSGSKSNVTAYFDTVKEIVSDNNQSAYKKSYTVTYDLNEDEHINDAALKKVTLNPVNTTVTQNWNVNGYFVNKNELYSKATVGSTSTNKNLLDKANNSYPNTYHVPITNKLIANNRVYSNSDMINGNYKVGNINYKDTNYAWISTKNLIYFYVKNLKLLNTTSITMYASYEPVELTLPSASRGDGAAFLGWFTVAQNDYAAIKSGIEHWKNEGNTNVSAYDLYYVGQPGEKFCVDENTTLYAWWNKQPTYVDIHEGVFFEGQTVTYDDLIQLVSVADYEEDIDNNYYIDLSTTYVDLVIKTVTEEYQNQLDIINAEIATKEANHYTAGTEAYYSNKEALNELYTRKNNITTEMNNKITELKSGNIDSSISIKSVNYKTTNSSISVNGNTEYMLDTKTDNIGEVDVIYTVTDNGIICGTTKLEPITQEYTRTIEIKINYNPLLYTSNIINYTTDTYSDPSGKYNGLGEYLVYMQSIKDSEDNRNNNPWWNSTSDTSNLRNASNANTKAKLESSIIITGIQNITYLPQYYYKVDNDGNYVYKDLLDSFTNDYTFNDSSTNRTTDVNNLYTNAQNYNGVNVWEMIQSMDIIFDGKDQWGKYSSDRILTEASVKGVNPTNNGDYTQSEIERTSKFILINVNMDEALITTNVAEKSRYISEKYLDTLENNSYWNTNSKELEEILNHENKNATSLQEFTINQNQTNETKIKIYDYTN